MFKNKAIHALYWVIIASILLYFSDVSLDLFGADEPDPSSSQNPDTFGSVAIPTTRSPYSEKWQHSAKSGSGLLWDRMLSEVSNQKSEKGKLASVQKIVNHTISWGVDKNLWGQDDYWSSPNETLRKGSGDCEDSAILKMMLLRAAGFPRENLYIVIGLDTVIKQAHAVLVVKSAGRFWVLNQRTDTLVTDDSFLYFAPVVSMNASRTWLHGYKLLGSWFTTRHYEDLPVVAK